MFKTMFIVFLAYVVSISAILFGASGKVGTEGIGGAEPLPTAIRIRTPRISPRPTPVDRDVLATSLLVETESGVKDSVRFFNPWWRRSPTPTMLPTRTVNLTPSKTPTPTPRR